MNEWKILQNFCRMLAFQEVRDGEGNTYILLQSEPMETVTYPIEDKTQFEALNNHEHLFDHVTRRNFQKLCPIAEQLGQTLLSVLQAQFPTREFMVFATLEVGESLILRFHQKWPDEPPYYDAAAPQKPYQALWCWE